MAPYRKDGCFATHAVSFYKILLFSVMGCIKRYCHTSRDLRIVIHHVSYSEIDWFLQDILSVFVSITD